MQSDRHEGCQKAFHQYSRSYYAKILPPMGERTVEEVMFGFYAREGGTSGEMAMRWIELQGHNTAQLQVFHDAFHALSCFEDLIQALAAYNDTDITPEEFCKLLKEHGFEDWTEEEMPNRTKRSE